MTLGYVAWYGLSSFLLGFVLFWPLRKLMMAISVNRYQRQTQAAISEEALDKLRHKMSLIAAVIAMTFAFLYNRFVMMQYFG